MPQFPMFRTSWKGRPKGYRLKYSLQGVMLHGHSFQLYGLMPWLLGTANYQVTSVLAALNTLRTFPYNSVYQQVDGGSENWSLTAWALGVILMFRYPALEVVRFSRQLVGHTPNDVDQKFSIMKQWFYGRKLKNETAQLRAVLTMGEFKAALRKAFAWAEQQRSEKAQKGLLMRKNKAERRAPHPQPRRRFTPMQETMALSQQAKNFDLRSIVEELKDKEFGGHGASVRSKQKKALGDEALHVVEFFKQTGGKIGMRFKLHMRDENWLQTVDDIFEEVFTGTYRSSSAKDTFTQLASGALTPDFEPFSDWQQSDDYR
jgi:hypothetical protein